MSPLATIPEGGRLALVRFSSLGDVALAAAVVAELRRRRPDLELAVLTKAAFAPLFESIPRVERWTLDGETDLEALRGMAARLRAWRPHLVADLHGTLRARLLRLLTLRLPWRRVAKDSVRRWLWAALGVPPRRQEHVVERYARVVEIPVSPGPWASLDGAAPRHELLLAPGARWRTKEWPASGWRALARWWQDERGGSVGWVGATPEGDQLRELRASEGGRLLVGLPLPELLRELAGAASLVSNDSAPGHLAAAVGTPVVALFGPTAPGFGFTPWGTHAVVERDLACRPCTLHGDDRCPLGHHACLSGLETVNVAEAVDRMIETTETAATGSGS